MNDKRKHFNIDSKAELEATSDTEKAEKINNSDHIGEKLLIIKDSLIYLSEKVKFEFFKYQKCLYICLFIYILDYIVWFVSKKHLKDLFNIFSLLVSLILSLFSIYLFKDELNFISKALNKCINKIIIINIISLIIYYINLLFIFNDKILKANFDGLLAKIFSNNKGLKMFYGIYLIINLLFPTLTLVYLLKVKKFLKILGIARRKYYVEKTKGIVKEEKNNELKLISEKLNHIKRQIVQIK